jgi:serine/threonine protein kinase
MINKYKIENKINTGSFGNVYKCSYNNKIYAIKEDKYINNLMYEAKIYNMIRGISNISPLINTFSSNNTYYLVLDYYKYNLKDFKYMYFSQDIYLLKVKNIILTIINTLKDIHELGIIHRDLKPTNICLNGNFVPFLIDFGLSKKIIINNKHIDIKNIKAVIGSYSFVSINVINLIEPSRRDDIESLVYIYMYMILTENKYIEYNNISLKSKKKLQIFIDFLTVTYDNTNFINNIIQLIKYIRKMHFSQKPNYDYISKLF